LGANALQHLEVLDLSGQSLQAEDLQALTNPRSLKQVDTVAFITAKRLSELHKLSAVPLVSLHNAGTESKLPHLISESIQDPKGQLQLQEVCITGLGGDVSPELRAVSALSTLSTLRSLWLSRLALQGPAVASLTALTHLTSLHLRDIRLAVDVDGHTEGDDASFPAFLGLMSQLRQLGIEVSGKDAQQVMGLGVAAADAARASGSPFLPHLHAWSYMGRLSSVQI
jgi:hypothetical protein